MSGKSIMLPAAATTAIRAVEAHARNNGLTIGTAAAELIEAGLTAAKAPPGGDTAPETMRIEDVHLDALLEQLRLRVERAENSDALTAAVARAEAAEGKLASIRAAFA